MKQQRYNPPIAVEVVWRDAAGWPGEADLTAEKGIVLRYIGYLAEVRDGFVSLVAEYAQDNPESMRDQGDIPLGDVISITRLHEGGRLYGKVQRQRRKQ